MFYTAQHFQLLDRRFEFFPLVVLLYCVLISICSQLLRSPGFGLIIDGLNCVGWIYGHHYGHLHLLCNWIFFPFFRSGAIVGARTLEYLLEKSRLVTQVRLHTGLQHDGACLG